MQNKMGQYIQNRLPIRLLQVSDMTFVSRGELQGKILDEMVHMFCPDEARYLGYSMDDPDSEEEDQEEEDQQKEDQEEENPENLCSCFKTMKEKLKYSILSHRWDSSELTFGPFLKCRQQLAESDNTSSK
jgi:hypothetical protein